MITLVLGGTRSGKSEVAERLATRAGEPVTYVATGAITDDGFATRVAAHQARRPASWSTVEQPTDLGATLMRLTGTVLVDSLGTWIASATGGDADVEGLSRALTLRRGTTILVSEEVGLGVHPPTEVGVRFADALGDCNRRIAQVADHVLLIIAGRTLALGQEH